jgi:hypothetical protein
MGKKRMSYKWNQTVKKKKRERGKSPKTKQHSPPPLSNDFLCHTQRKTQVVCGPCPLSCVPNPQIGAD